MTKKHEEKTLNGLFIIDIKDLKLSQSQLHVIDNALQATVQSELAKLDDTEGLGLRGGPLGGGIAGFMANQF